MTPDSIFAIEESEQLAGHFVACFTGLYEALGEGASKLTDDATVVVVFEMARTFGDTASSFRSLLAHRAGVDPEAALGSVPEIKEVLLRAINEDPSGALCLYAVSMVIAPLLLVSLRDAGSRVSLVSAGPLSECTAKAADVVVGAIRQIGDLAESWAPVLDDAWRESAKALGRTFEASGYNESLGLGLFG
jgi:hypothetical protein